MPIFEQSYPTWNASDERQIRWWPIVRRELQILSSQKAFKFLAVAGILPVLIFLLQIYSVNKLAADPGSELARVLRNLDHIMINGEFFLNFLKIQASFVFVLVLYAGSGLVCDDIRWNLIEVYFSKPLTLRDYLVGKILTVTSIGFAYTAVPVCFLFVSHALMTPGTGFVGEYAWVIPSSLALSAGIVIPAALASLACSSLTQSRRNAAAVIITLVAANSFLVTMVAEILRSRSIYIASVPSAISHFGDLLFGERLYINLGWFPTLFVIGGVSLIGFFVLRRRIRKVEVAW